MMSEPRWVEIRIGEEGGEEGRNGGSRSGRGECVSRFSV